MPSDAPKIKIQKTQEYGAEVIFMIEMKITERRLDLVLPWKKEENLLNPSMI